MGSSDNDNANPDATDAAVDAAIATEALSLEDAAKDTSESVDQMSPANRKSSIASPAQMQTEVTTAPEIDAQLQAIDEAANLDANIDPQFAQELIQATSGVIGDAAVGNLLAGGDLLGDGINGTGSGTTGKSKKKVRREYLPEEIPEEYREKPQHSYSHLIATALRSRAPISGLSLSDIYKAIQEIFPYYEYCPHGWQNSVRHNLSSNKAFRKVSKEGKGWLWGIDEEYFLEKERQKKKAAAAKSKAAAIQAAQQAARQQQQLQQQQQQQQLQLQQLQLQQQQNEINNILNASTDEQLQLLQQLQQPKKQKSIAELAREIEINRNADGTNYHPNYSEMTRESLGIAGAAAGGASSRSSLSGSTRILPTGSGSRQASFTEYNPGTGAVAPVSPSPNSIQAQLAANLQQRQAALAAGRSSTPSASTTPPLVQPSLAAGQNTFRMAKLPKQSTGVNSTPLVGQPSLKQSTSVPQMRVQPSKFYQPGSGQTRVSPSPSTASTAAKPNATVAAVQLAGLSLSPETIKALGALQQKIQTKMQSMGIGTGANSQILTNVLAVAIAQMVKTGGADSIASLLNGKNPAQLTQLLETALTAMSKKKAPAGSSQATGSGTKPVQNSPVTASVVAPSTSTVDLTLVSPGSDSPVVISTTTSVTASPVVAPAVSSTTSPVVNSTPSNGALGGSDSVNTPVTAPVVVPTTAVTPTAAATTTIPTSTVPVNIPTATTTTNLPPAANAPAASSAGTAAPTTAPATSTTATKPAARPSAATIAQLLAQASKISNPSPSMKAALEQLRAHASKLNAVSGVSAPAAPANAGSTDTAGKRPPDEPIESLDNSAVKASKSG